MAHLLRIAPARFCIEQLNGTAWSEIAAQGANTTAYLVAGLSAGTSYSFRVRAHTDASSANDGYSDYSNEASALTFPAAPTGLSAEAKSSTRINLSWSDGPGIEDGFHLQRSDNGGTAQVCGHPC